MSADFVSIPLPGGHQLLIDVADLRVALGFTWRAKKNRHVFYAAANRRLGRGGPCCVYLHTLLMDPGRGMTVDHIDGNGLNNRRSNLRLCTPMQNQQNSAARKGKTSIYKGVTRPKRARGWRAQIRVNRQLILLGTFAQEEDAARAYDDAARRHFGPFARTNFPEKAA